MASFVVVVVGWVFFFFGGGGGGGGRGDCYILFEKKIWRGGGWKICNVSVMLLLLYVHVCVTRSGWKTRPRPKTVILSITKSNQIKYHIICLLWINRSGAEPSFAIQFL